MSRGKSALATMPEVAALARQQRRPQCANLCSLFCIDCIELFSISVTFLLIC